MISIRNHNRKLLTILLMAAASLAKAQRPMTVSLFNESTTIPFSSFINTPVHPGVQIGTEFNWKQGKHFSVYPTVNIGYMFHKNLFQAFYLNAELGVDYQTTFGLNVKSRVGLGYLRSYRTQQEFQLRGGQYESKPDRGNGRMMPSLSLGLGYDIRNNDPYSPELYVMYQSWIEYPYSPGFIPLMAHTNAHVGIKFYTSKTKIKK